MTIKKRTFTYSSGITRFSISSMNADPEPSPLRSMCDNNLEFIHSAIFYTCTFHQPRFRFALFIQPGSSHILRMFRRGFPRRNFSSAMRVAYEKKKIHSNNRTAALLLLNDDGCWNVDWWFSRIPSHRTKIALVQTQINDWVRNKYCSVFFSLWVSIYQHLFYDYGVSITSVRKLSSGGICVLALSVDVYRCRKDWTEMLNRDIARKWNTWYFPCIKKKKKKYDLSSARCRQTDITSIQCYTYIGGYSGTVGHSALKSQPNALFCYYYFFLQALHRV